MQEVCSVCHARLRQLFYKQYDDFVVLYNEKFAKPGAAIMRRCSTRSCCTKSDFDEESSGPGSTCGITKAAARATARR
jgi:hypothetical protein